jgi:hypothetical protein
MCRISPIHDDWVKKGCHIHVGRIEVALRPNHRGRIVCRKVFAATSEETIKAASKRVAESLEDPKWRRKLRNRLVAAMDYLLKVEGDPRPRARSRLAELHRLIIAIDRLEHP